MSDSIKICAIGIAFVIICVLIREYRAEYLIPARIAALIFLAGTVIVLMSPIVELLKRLIGQTVSNQYLEIFLKALAIAYMTQISSDLCKDSGETGIATGIEAVGKVEILLLSIPLINKIIAMSEELLLW